METKRKMTDEEIYKVARKRVHAKRDFLTHFVIYIAVNIFLAFMNIFYTPGYLWFLWPVFGWGIGVAAHGINTYVKLNLDEAAILKEMEKLKNKGI